MLKTFINCEARTMVLFIGVGASKFWGIFDRIFPNLLEKFLCDFCLQIFPQKDHEDLFWCDFQNKIFICFSANVGRNFQTTFGHHFCLNFQGFLPRFSGVLPGFSTNQNFWGALASPPPTPLVLSTDQ